MQKIVDIINIKLSIDNGRVVYTCTVLSTILPCLSNKMQVQVSSRDIYDCLIVSSIHH